MAPRMSNSEDGGKRGRRNPLAELLRNPRIRPVNNDGPTMNVAMMQTLGLTLRNQVRPVVAQPAQEAPQRQMLLHQLLQTLRAPTTLEQQQQVLQILRSNPQLMTAFIRHRQHQHQIQQQQAGSQAVHQPLPGQNIIPASGLNSQQHQTDQTDIIQNQGQQNMGMDGQMLMPQQQGMSQQSVGSSDAQGQQQQ